MSPSANPSAERAQQLFVQAEKAVAFYQDIGQQLDLVAAKQHLRNAADWIENRHYKAVISNSERAIGAVADAFEAQISLLEKDFPELAQAECGNLRVELFRWVQRAKAGEGIEDLYNLPERLVKIRQKLLMTPTKNIPQRGRPRVDKKSSRGPGRYRRRPR